MAKLCIEGVSKAFGEKQVLSDINLTAESGEFVALLGPSGCGKTTLLNTISGILRSDAGRVWWMGGISAACPWRNGISAWYSRITRCLTT